MGVVGGLDLSPLLAFLSQPFTLPGESVAVLVVGSGGHGPGAVGTRGGVGAPPTAYQPQGPFP
jgi:hypothetical protein